MSGRERYDRKIRADEAEVGDELHLTVMGGDEYVTLEKAEPASSTETRFKWTSWGGPIEDVVASDMPVWVKK